MTIVAFYGTCQLAAVEAVVRAHLARAHGLETFFVAAWTDLSDTDRARIEAADVFVGQRLRFGCSAEGIAARGRPVIVPLIDNAFLWPFAGEAHPRNTVHPFHPYGPYPAEFGDRFLNRQIAEGVDPDVAAERYLALDVNAVVRLDRLREMSIDHQHHLDAETGFRMTPFVEAYQPAPLFRTAYHFELGLLHELAAQVVTRLGLGTAEASLLRRLARQNPMLDAWLPIHPAVAQHFGLSYGDAATRYRYFDEGAFTFAEYARRYVAYAWNRPLHEGAHLALAGQDAAAVPLLREGVALSPGSAHAHWRLAQSLERTGDVAGMTAAAARAVVLAPADAPMRDTLSRAHLRAGDTEGALAEALMAVALDPSDAERQAFLAWLYAGRGEHAAALPHIAEALALCPELPHLHVLHGDILFAIGRLAGAEVAYQGAEQIDPAGAAGPAGMARALLAAGRPDDARVAVLRARGCAPDDADHAYLHARIEAARGEAEAAEAAAREAVALAPARADLWAGLASLLFEAGRHAGALDAIGGALALDGDNGDYRALAAHLHEVLAQAADA